MVPFNSPSGGPLQVELLWVQFVGSLSGMQEKAIAKPIGNNQYILIPGRQIPTLLYSSLSVVKQ